MIKERVFVTEEMRRKKIGMKLGKVVEEVEGGWIRRFCQAIDDPNPLFYNESFAKQTVHGGIIAPPTFFFAFDPSQRGEIRPIFDEPVLEGVAHAGDEWEIFQAIRPGDVITGENRLVELVEKEGRTGKLVFEVIESTFKNQRGELVAKALVTHVVYPEGRKKNKEG